MTLIEHLLELRDRLFKAALALVIGLAIAMFFAKDVLDIITDPYCHGIGKTVGGGCDFNITSPADYFLLKLKVGLYLGIIASSPVWLFQLWSFITPGLHRNEKRWAYGFITVATPLFTIGAVLANIVVSKGLEFLLPAKSDKIHLQLSIVGYVDFVTGMIMVFGVGFEFPLIVFMLNLAGVLSARRLLGWWRAAVFLIFLFCAIVTPTPDPFGMTLLAVPMCVLYFAAVGAAFVNERRRAKARVNTEHEALHDDEASELDYRPEPIEEPVPAEPSAHTDYHDRDVT
ncbi:MAG: Sec-independent protein translocase, TatC subunit [Actinomycetia bacterium]|nr:Sec-independent protein translocase, TatC subunit [Actinomycetes bacterium]